MQIVLIQVTNTVTSHPSVHPFASFWLTVIDTAVKVTAIVAGGIWAWMNYVRNRTHKRRLEPTVSGSTFVKNKIVYLAICCQLKNVGQSLYEITPTGTACEVTAISPAGRSALYTFGVFSGKNWIEPGERIDWSGVVEIGGLDGYVALSLGLRVVSGGHEWNTSCIVTAPDPPNSRKWTLGRC
jgi:hypothetical protein